MQSKVLPILPIRNKVLLPGMVARLQFSSSQSTQLVEELLKIHSKTSPEYIAVVPFANSQAASIDDAIVPGELYSFGVVAKVISIRRFPGKIILTLEGVDRIKIERVLSTTPITAEISYVPLETKINDSTPQLIELKNQAVELSQILSHLQFPSSALTQLKKMMETTPATSLADFYASMIDSSFDDKLLILSLVDPIQRIEKVIEFLKRQVQVLKISQNVQRNVDGKTGKLQREQYLRQQLKSIKKELGEQDEDSIQEESEILELEKKITSANPPPEAKKIITRELKRLKSMQTQMAEYQIVRTYIEWLCEIPWNSSPSPQQINVKLARDQLEKDHYGLEKVKNRITEYLAVLKLKKGDVRGPILCFIGPPGVGKTSLGKSIADALGRKFHRISLGGVRDEAEIRGHRRTYIGAMPGLIVQGLRKVGTNNPVFLFDEIDKLSRDNRGDPASAMLEVLDPEQNSTFSDHYINTPVDLSKILFIATANESDTIPKPVLDRMEVIRIPGYSFAEKSHIAKKYLIPKQIKQNGLSDTQTTFTDEAVLKIAVGYTREAGVRGLEREIARVCRGLAIEFSDSIENGKNFSGFVDVEQVEKYLGHERFEIEISERSQIPGVANGLAWTSSGSGGLLFIEASTTSGNGKIQLTGMLGDVIKESAQLAITWVRANAVNLGLSLNFLDNKDIHLHFPAGATPKDGPSAGITIITALVSLFLNTPIIDHTAMTGEVTLRGQVLPVGGIKEKILAAHRAGIKRIIIPLKNKKDLEEDVPEIIRKELDFFYAANVSDVIKNAFEFGGNMVLGIEKEKQIWQDRKDAVTRIVFDGAHFIQSKI